VFHNGYTGNCFEQYILFFTKLTDLSGYNGGFTPAHHLNFTNNVTTYLSKSWRNRTVSICFPKLLCFKRFSQPRAYRAVPLRDGFRGYSYL